MSRWSGTGEDVRDPIIIANVFNDYFSKIVINIRDQMEKPTYAYLDLIRENPISIDVPVVTPREVFDIVECLELRKSSACLPVLFIKLCNPYLSRTLCNFFNLCISSGVYPYSLKVARVCPIYKAGDKKNVDNYRPNSVLPSINKIFEKLICNRMTEFYISHNIILQHQYGFMKGRDTQQAALH